MNLADRWHCDPRTIDLTDPLAELTLQMMQVEYEADQINQSRKGK